MPRPNDLTPDDADDDRKATIDRARIMLDSLGVTQAEIHQTVVTLLMYGATVLVDLTPVHGRPKAMKILAAALYVTAETTLLQDAEHGG